MPVKSSIFSSSLNSEMLRTAQEMSGQHIVGPWDNFIDIINSISHAFVLTTTELEMPGPTILHANPAFVKMCGYDLDELVGNTPRLLQGELTDPAGLMEFKKKMNEVGHAAMQVINYRKNGESYLCSIIAARVETDSPHGSVFFAAEIDLGPI